MRQSLFILMLPFVAAVAFGAPAGTDELSLALQAEAPDLDSQILDRALTAASCAWTKEIADPGILSIIDYSLPSTEPRLWIFDVPHQKLIYHELVAHGVNTGENLATEFSNRHGSRQSSLGLFLTAGTYVGRNGYSLKLHGLVEGINHNAWDRTIVLHGAWYVSEVHSEKYGRLGRSWGCPAVEREVAKPLIDTIKQGSLLFVYYPDSDWLTTSPFLNGCSLPPDLARNPRHQLVNQPAVEQSAGQ